MKLANITEGSSGSSCNSLMVKVSLSLRKFMIDGIKRRMELLETKCVHRRTSRGAAASPVSEIFGFQQ